jgi:rRNA maturation protein Nop10
MNELKLKRFMTNENEQFKGHCPYCGGKMNFQGEDYAFRESLRHNTDDYGVAHYGTCSQCGRDFLVIDPTPEERNDEYKEYWKDHQSELKPKYKKPDYGENIQ